MIKSPQGRSEPLTGERQSISPFQRGTSKSTEAQTSVPGWVRSGDEADDSSIRRLPDRGGSGSSAGQGGTDHKLGIRSSMTANIRAMGVSNPDSEARSSRLGREMEHEVEERSKVKLSHGSGMVPRGGRLAGLASCRIDGMTEEPRQDLRS